MFNILFKMLNKEEMLVILVSLLITILIILIIKCLYSSNKKDFNEISKTLNNINIVNNEKARLI